MEAWMETTFVPILKRERGREGGGRRGREDEVEDGESQVKQEDGDLDKDDIRADLEEGEREGGRKGGREGG